MSILLFHLIILFDFDESVIVGSRDFSEILAHNKYLYFFITLFLVPCYTYLCGFYGTKFLQFLSRRVCTFFILSAYFFTGVLVLCLHIFFPDIEIFIILILIYEKLPNFYALASFLLFCWDGRTLMHRKGFYFENWKFFTFMHLQMYLFGYLLGFCIWNAFFTLFWIFPEY